MLLRLSGYCARTNENVRSTRTGTVAAVSYGGELTVASARPRRAAA
jgi:hypothetical protein